MWTGSDGLLPRSITGSTVHKENQRPPEKELEPAVRWTPGVGGVRRRFTGRCSERVVLPGWFHGPGPGTKGPRTWPGLQTLAMSQGRAAWDARFGFSLCQENTTLWNCDSRHLGRDGCKNLKRTSHPSHSLRKGYLPSSCLLHEQIKEQNHHYISHKEVHALTTVQFHLTPNVWITSPPSLKHYDQVLFIQGLLLRRPRYPASSSPCGVPYQ